MARRAMDGLIAPPFATASAFAVCGKASLNPDWTFGVFPDFDRAKRSVDNKGSIDRPVGRSTLNIFHVWARNLAALRRAAFCQRALSHRFALLQFQARKDNVLRLTAALTWRAGHRPLRAWCVGLEMAWSRMRFSDRSRGLSTGVLAATLMVAGLLCASSPVLAGPPYLTDDPEPTDYQHYEIYTFINGINARDGTSGESGIDFNYGGAPNLQLTATIPMAYDFPGAGGSAIGAGNIELAAKYRFLTQQNFGLDVAVFPRVFLPSASPNAGTQHASFLLPVWLEKDWGQWSAFGGGGCAVNRGGNSQDYCEAGIVVARQVRTDLQIGLELFHQSADTIGGDDMTSIGTGIRYDMNDHLHLLGYVGRGIQNADETDRLNWYTSVLFTF